MKGKRPRTERRAAVRANAKLADARVKLANLEPGGSPANPIDLVSASLVEVHARSIPCPRCDGELRVHDHTAETIDGVRLRVVRTACFMCGSERKLFFRITSVMPN